MHPILGLLMLIGVGAFVAFAFRQGMQVRRDGRPDNGDAYGATSLLGHHGGFGHG